MPYEITDDCVVCGSCKEECPNDAIKEGEDKFHISEDCIECGACVEACPSNAIIEV
jgi:NAD-dependent dihydropyrimidine dehydrogenase PreA subunit